jgi:hypothetical protein
MLPRRRFTGLIALAMSVTAAAAGAAPVTVHGMVSQGYLNSSDYNYLTPDTEQGTFSFNEVLVNFTSQIDDKTRIGLQLLGRDLGPQGNGEVIVDWGFGDRWKDELGFRAGSSRRPGILQQDPRRHAVRRLPQSASTRATAGEHGRPGHGSLRNLPFGGTGGVDYELCVEPSDGFVAVSGSDMAALAGCADAGLYDRNKVPTADRSSGTPLRGPRIGGTFH